MKRIGMTASAFPFLWSQLCFGPAETLAPTHAIAFGGGIFFMINEDYGR